MSTFFPALRAWKRRRVLAEPFPEAWEAILAEHAPFVARLSEEDGKRLREKIRIFLAEKSFEGLGGLEMTDEIRVTIAAQACRLVLHQGDRVYPKLRSILVYPTAYDAPMLQQGRDGIVTEGTQRRLGEAWTMGAVVLSWNDVQFGAADVKDGQNVVLHEFAHQLDMEDRTPDGAPILGGRSQYVAWARVLGEEYETLQEKMAKRNRTVMDKYGATNPAEFFAVATETFFEKSRTLQRKHPELYEQLREFYRQDPAAR